ncbi:hypothetical protein JCM19233_197 [Vibrio astriarenae]|nr:hypothetical protein JCM19233_197 [Vibrio sp. C7]
MNKLSKVSVAVATLLATTAVSAASFDVRMSTKKSLSLTQLA